ncbi:pseudouridine synthase [Sphingomonas cynarae]
MTDQEPPKGDRIAKLLARAGIASRRDIERMIAEGRIALNGVTLDTPATVLITLDGVTVDGHAVAAPPPAQLFLYHKPPGLLVTEHDPAGRPIIYDHLPRDLPRVVPVGRLDLNTEGLLLLTTDGGFKRQLELPATGVERTYRARAYGDVTQAQLEDLIEGIEIEGMRYGPIDANLERRTGANVWIEMTLTEGKNREVRRVLEHLGLQVSRLIRTRYGPFVLGDLMPGEVGEVRGADIGAFRRTLDSPRRAREPMANVEVEARGKATAPAPIPAAPPPPAARPVEEARRPRPAPTASARPAAAGGGWGSRTRPSRPAANAAPAPTDRFRSDRPRGDGPRPDQTGATGPRPGHVSGNVRSDRPYRDASPRPDRPIADAPRQGGGRSDRQRQAGGGRPTGSDFRGASSGTNPRPQIDRASPRADRPAGDAPRQDGGRSDRPRQASGGRPAGNGFRGAFSGGDARPQSDRASPRADRSRNFRDRRDDDGAPARPTGDRTRGAAPAYGRDDRSGASPRGPARAGAGPNRTPGAARPGGKPPGKGGSAKGPAGGRGHPPRAPKGKR